MIKKIKEDSKEEECAGVRVLPLEKVVRKASEVTFKKVAKGNESAKN